MSQTKRITGNLILDPTGNVQVLGDLQITGDFTVVGTTSTITTTDTSIKDRQIVLNDGESGAGVTGQYSGLRIDRGSLDDVWFVFDENTDTFKVSYDNGSTFPYVLDGTSSGINNVVEDTTPQLGGDLDVNGKNIVSASTNEDIQLVPNGTGRVTVASALKLNDQSAPSSAAGSTLMYANTASAGGTGVFFVDGSTSDELVSKSRAVAYGIIF
jgi:hypothetical protein